MLTGSLLEALITATAGSGFLLFGYDQGVMSGLLTGSAFTRQFPEIDTTATGHGSPSLQGTVVAIYEIGCFFGAIFTFFAGEQLGRRRIIMIGSIVLSIGAALQAAAFGIPQLIVGRIVAGLGNGLNTATIPVWHSELMKPTNRGRGLSIELAVTLFGVMVSYWTDYGMSFVENQSQFRFPIAFQIVFAISTFLLIMIVPESPRWLIAHGKLEEATLVLWRLHPDHKHISDQDPIIVAQVEEIKTALKREKEASDGTGLLSILKSSPQRYRYRTLLGVGGQFMQQLSGINSIVYYAPVIFQESIGLSHRLSILLTGFNGIAHFFAALIPIWCLDRLGRRRSMIFAAVGQCACMAILAGAVADGGKSAGIVAVVVLFVFNFFYAIGLLAIPWLLPAEYAPLAIRTKAAALATASNWIFTFLVVEIVPVSISTIHWKTYVYFAIFNAAFVPLVYLFYPEVKNLSLEQIDKLFTGPKVKMHWQPEMDEQIGSLPIEPSNHMAISGKRVGTASHIEL